MESLWTPFEVDGNDPGVNESESPVEPTAPAVVPAAPDGEPPDNELPAASASPWWRRPRRSCHSSWLLPSSVTFALTRGGDDKISVVGTMVLTDADASWTVGEPRGTGRFSDISDGTAVTVKNEKGAIIATGAPHRTVRFVVNQVPVRHHRS